jgi:hypothetical protein
MPNSNLDIATSDTAKSALDKIGMDDVQLIFDEIKKVEKEFKSKQFIKIPYGKFDDIDIYLVDGDYIMKKPIYPDFTQGGNGQIYGVKAKEEGKPKFIPEKEIWIDINMDSKEYPFIILHECLEMKLMESGIRYDQDNTCAHPISNEVEQFFRRKYE